MAAGEARTGWQHRSNYCYVHGDVRSAQRFSRRPSSSSFSKESDCGGNENGSNGIDHLIPDCMLYNSNPELTRSSRWWLNLEPNFGSPSYEQCKGLEAELEDLTSGYVNKTAIISDYYQCKEVFSTQSDREKYGNSFVEKPCKVSVPSPKSDQTKKMQELKAGAGDVPQLHKKRDAGEEFWYSDDDFMNLDSFTSSEQDMKLSSDLDSQWVVSEKSEPWWRSAGKDELASFVAQKSLENVENCDLPKPQNIKHRRLGPASSTKFLDPSLSLEQMADSSFSNIDTYTRGSLTSGHSTYESDSPSSHNNGSAATSQDEPIDERSKAQLLEALCHSQTRARKAEKAAQQAYTEKEHIISMFFKQASQLFAYKQWLQLLQIENFCLQLNNKDGLPWSPYKSRPAKKKGQRKAGKRDGRPSYEFSKGIVAFALGLGLASAGLLLGWTMGWLFPSA